MFYVNGTNIKLTRGDSASLSVSLDGYEMQDGDALPQQLDDQLTLRDTRHHGHEHGRLVLFMEGDIRERQGNALLLLKQRTRPADKRQDVHLHFR